MCIKSTESKISLKRINNINGHEKEMLWIQRKTFCIIFFFTPQRMSDYQPNGISKLVCQ